MKSEIGDGCEFGLAAVLWVVARNSTTDIAVLPGGITSHD